MLFQIHHQYPDGTTDFLDQNYFPVVDGKLVWSPRLHDWVLDIMDRHQLPDGCQFNLFSQEHEKFLWCWTPRSWTATKSSHFQIGSLINSDLYANRQFLAS